MEVQLLTSELSWESRSSPPVPLLTEAVCRPLGIKWRPSYAGVGGVFSMEDIAGAGAAVVYA